MSANLERVLSEIRTLTAEELRQVRTALEERMRADEPGLRMTEDEFEQNLLAKGIISEVPARRRDYTAHRDFQPVRILDGKPISETIIEERR